MPEIMLGKGEKIIRENDNVFYHGGSARIGHPMWGKLVLTNKRFLFFEMKVEKTGGIFGIGGKQQKRIVGARINIPTQNVLSAMVETRTRKKGTLNEPPTLLSKEEYKVLMVSLENPMGGVENPVFEVQDPDGWVYAIQQTIGGETLE